MIVTFCYAIFAVMDGDVRAEVAGGMWMLKMGVVLGASIVGELSRWMTFLRMWFSGTRHVYLG